MTTTLEALVDTAISEAAGGDDPAFARFIPGTLLSPGLVALVHRNDGFFWMVSAVASWVMTGADEKCAEGFDDAGINAGAYQLILDRWCDLRESMQMFDMRRHGSRGAELCVRGGADLTDDDSNTLHPIQRWSYAQIPWSDDEPFRVWACRQLLADGRAVWVLMLPREY